MKLAMIGLGTMGANMSRRLIEAGHEVVGFDPRTEAVETLQGHGGLGAQSLTQAVEQLYKPRVLWIMVPAGEIVDQTLEELKPLLNSGDIVIDGGNSNYKDTLRRAEDLKSSGLHYVDAGTSGGVWGLKEGYSLMVGGDGEAIQTIRPLLEALAPSAEEGWGHVGPCGAGHFVKMVHNGIEYGVMQAYAEGFAIMREKEEFNLDLHQVGEIWQKGSVIRSWLLDLSVAALSDNPTLKGVAPWVADSGEGRWTVKEAIDLDVPAPVITLALQRRLSSRVDDSFADKLLAALRNQFGGHAIKQEETS